MDVVGSWNARVAHTIPHLDVYEGRRARGSSGRKSFVVLFPARLTGATCVKRFIVVRAGAW